jgi:hypothetical protein
VSHDGPLPQGEALRRALRWLSDERRHNAAAIEEAARRFDLTPADEEFLLRHLCVPTRDGSGPESS